MSALLCVRMLRHYSGKVDQLLKIQEKLDALLFSVTGTGTKATSGSEILAPAHPDE